MRSIWKFQFGASNRPALRMPDGAKVLSVQMQDSLITLWAEVDTTAVNEDRFFRVFGTGFDMPREMGHSDVYLGTVQDADGFVWHVYEDKGI